MPLGHQSCGSSMTNADTTSSLLISTVWVAMTSLLEPADFARLSEGMRHLPAHPDVRNGVQMLRKAGFRTAALTNSTLKVGLDQIQNAGLTDLFESVLSADTVSRLKPAPEPYQMAARVLGTELRDLRMVAAHGWDVAGAMAAGCKAAFIARPGQRLDPLAPKPDIVAPDLIAAATAIIQSGYHDQTD